MMVHADNLLVGDIIKISRGMKVPADGVIVRSSGVVADESVLIGSNEECQKEPIKVCL
jgi:magnesium-transporting ATPase (P-type)